MKHTMTSNCSGFATSCIQQLSTIISLQVMLGYFLATSRQDSKNKPSASFMMLALCTAVTFFLLLRQAYSKAYFAIRSEQNFVITQQRNRIRTITHNIKRPLANEDDKQHASANIHEKCNHTIVISNQLMRNRTNKIMFKKMVSNQDSGITFHQIQLVHNHRIRHKMFIQHCFKFQLDGN